jgi:hypothetical protein
MQVEQHPAFRTAEFTPHDFRCLLATELVNSGLPTLRSSSADAEPLAKRTSAVPWTTMSKNTAATSSSAAVPAWLSLVNTAMIARAAKLVPMMMATAPLPPSQRLTGMRVRTGRGVRHAQAPTAPGQSRNNHSGFRILCRVLTV